MSSPRPWLIPSIPSSVSRLVQVRDPAVAQRRRPPVRLVPALDHPVDVQAPHRLARLEPERLEGDGEFRHPSVGRDPGGGVPDAVPVERHVLGVVCDLAVGASAGRVHLEKEAVAMVEEGVDDDGDRVVAFEVGVAGQLRRNDVFRVPIPAEDAHVERRRGVQAPSPRSLRWRPPLRPVRAAPADRWGPPAPRPGRRGCRPP